MRGVLCNGRRCRKYRVRTVAAWGVWAGGKGEMEESGVQLGRMDILGNESGRLGKGSPVHSESILETGLHRFYPL